MRSSYILINMESFLLLKKILKNFCNKRLNTIINTRPLFSGLFVCVDKSVIIEGINNKG